MENMRAEVDNVSGSDFAYSPDSTAAVGSGGEYCSNADSDWSDGGAFAIRCPYSGVGMGYRGVGMGTSRVITKSMLSMDTTFP
jgi:hypothetical protein